MPYGDRRQVAVPCPGDADVLHGFNTDVSEATSTALGHTAVDASNLASTIFGINSPKPATAKKFFGTNSKGYEQSFIAAGSIATARADGWEIKPIKIMTLGNTTFARICFVEAKISSGSVGSYLFAWRMPLWQYNAITEAERTALGIQTFNPANDQPLQMIFGVTSKNSKPKRARKRSVVNGRTRVISTFVDYTKEDNKPVGWA
ncbi:hypothetical protein DSM106972_025370 [Dulcicalothrix desertica PCC 7102]|uniref:Uncharacterized protein n=1 Tax=Dulcicalothrix desertica PCC 7102 TaxID=232991 RepID=A0A3S1DC95_9CYAN|nr:hypothetical protein [Dulcicalothrix desertica]RUT07276.1 hypothetical protein DSM106972_025370 [Dulcicalothrix desertica PCC 7102]TWH55520.1 hypothetical protein CAL7102_03664 [Dulcicalothrix desertica PCC 7102]